MEDSFTRTTHACLNCKEKIEELTQVNELWRKDCGNLTEENFRLKAAMESLKRSKNIRNTCEEGASSASTSISKRKHAPTYTVEDVETMKMQMKKNEEECFREKKLKLQFEQESNEWKSKYERMVRVNRDLTEKINTLEFRLKLRENSEKGRTTHISNMNLDINLKNQANKVKVMTSDVFPKKTCCDEHSKGGPSKKEIEDRNYRRLNKNRMFGIDERDNIQISKNYQQQRQQSSQHYEKEKRFGVDERDTYLEVNNK